MPSLQAAGGGRQLWDASDDDEGVQKMHKQRRKCILSACKFFKLALQPQTIVRPMESSVDPVVYAAQMMIDAIDPYASSDAPTCLLLVAPRGLPLKIK